MNRQTASYLKWAGVLLIFANIMAWEAMYLAKRWRPPSVVAQPRKLQDRYPDTVCPEQKVIHTKCPACECRMKDKVRLETELMLSQQQRDGFEHTLRSHQDELRSLRSAVKQQESAVRIANPEVVEKAVLIATLVKNANNHVPTYFANLGKLTYPRNLISLALIVSDSLDGSAKAVRTRVSELKGTYRRATVLARDFGYQQAPDPKANLTADDELYRRSILARSRNFLLFEALRDEGWVMWLDVDIVQYPPDLIQQLMAHEADIATANCVYLDDSSVPTDRRCDEGAWAETPESLEYVKMLAPNVPLFEAYPLAEAYVGLRRRLGSEQFADNETVPLDAVGAVATLIRADLHRDGLLFPHVLFEHQIEAEGLGKMAVASGYQPIGLPGLVVHHAAVHIPPQPQW